MAHGGVFLQYGAQSYMESKYTAGFAYSPSQSASDHFLRRLVHVPPIAGTMGTTVAGFLPRFVPLHHLYAHLHVLRECDRTLQLV